MTHHTSFFKLTETACRCGCGGGTKPGDMDERIMFVATAVRLHFRKPVVISSAYRCPKHNAAVKGAGKSRHLPRDKAGNLAPVGVADALDIRIAGVSAQEVQEFIKTTFPTISIGLGKDFTHIDCRPVTATRPRVIFNY
ncbi:MAG: D-Ala-D-Ala carboxypeptidase family metallohydrolase [Aeromonadaceae bacterium]